MARRPRQLVLLAVGVWLIWLVVDAVLAGSHLSKARLALTSAKRDLGRLEVARAEGDLRTAARETASARGATHGWLWRATEHIPVLGRSFRSVAVVSTAADDVTHETLPLALEALHSLESDRIRRPDGSIDVAYLQTAGTALDRALQSSTRAGALGRSAPHSLLLPFTGGARRDFVAAADSLTAGLTKAHEALELAPALLGEDRSRTYFVAIQQYAEARGTGGLIGGYAIVRADHGLLTVEQRGSNRELGADVHYVSPPTGLPAGYLGAYVNYDVLGSWSNINIPPDLPGVSLTIAAKWKALKHQSVDGVIVMDGLALQNLLAGTPPITLGRTKIKPEHIADYLAFDQYENVKLDLASLRRRKDSLEQVAAVVLSHLTDSEGGGHLVAGLLNAVRSGHLKMASADPALHALTSLGVDGSLPQGDAPTAYPVIINTQGSKLDQWIHRSVRWTCRKDGQVEVSVAMTNRVPDVPLPPYIGLDLRPGASSRSTRTDAVHLDLYVTRGARFDSAAVDGTRVARTALTSGRVRGVPFWGTDLDLPAGRTVTFTLVLRDAGTGDQVRFLEQPLALPMSSDVAHC